MKSQRVTMAAKAPPRNQSLHPCQVSSLPCYLLTIHFWCLSLGSNFSFEDEIETALQNYIQVEHAGNILMPTINFQTPTLKESEFKRYIEKDEVFK